VVSTLGGAIYFKDLREQWWCYKRSTAELVGFEELRQDALGAYEKEKEQEELFIHTLSW